ncbi:MAG: biliverdin-producing heme oxygenase [Candidatus Cyclobacteriaceae bacterium M2_1C_046]
MLLEKLRSATADAHKDTEQLLFTDFRNISKSEYCIFLQSNYLFHVHFEPFILKADFITQDEWKAFNRKKLGNIIQDLKDLNCKLPEVRIENVFSNMDEAELLGAAYVSEGSSLGGQVILKQLKKTSFFDEEKHGRFLKSNGINTGLAWKDFLKLLEYKNDNQDQVIKGAINAFNFFQLCIKNVQGNETSK